MSLGQENVFRFDVPVQDALLMSVRERVRDFSRQADRVVDRQAVLAVQPVAQALAFDKRHRVPQLPGARLAGIEHGDDPRMLEPCDQRDLAAEAVGAKARGEAAVQYFERDRPTVFLIIGQIDGRRPAASELAGYPVALDRIRLHMAKIR
jgi:hypothetical protein